MRYLTLVALLFAGSLAGKPTWAQSARVGRCQGASLDFDQVAKRCAVRSECRQAPSPKALVVTVAPTSVKSGQTTQVEISG